jgi:hypothetical protein
MEKRSVVRFSQERLALPNASIRVLREPAHQIGQWNESHSGLLAWRVATPKTRHILQHGLSVTPRWGRFVGEAIRSWGVPFSDTLPISSLAGLHWRASSPDFDRPSGRFSFGFGWDWPVSTTRSAAENSPGAVSVGLISGFAIQFDKIDQQEPV